MRILFGITKSHFGGAQRYVYDLARELKHLGHDIKVAVGGNGLLVAKLDQESIPVIHIPSFGRDISIIHDVLSFFFIIETLYNERPSVFHVNSSKMGALGVLAGRVMGIQKIIFTAHGWAFNEERPRWQKIVLKTLYWFTILLSHTTICVSEKTKQDIDSWPFIKQKIRVIHNGIEDFPLLSQDEARTKLGISKPLVVGTIAELHPIKGLDVLLHAWKATEQKYAAELVIIGEGQEKSKLENLHHELTLRHVSFKGFLEDAKSYLKAFDIFVLPSYSEGLPYVLLEAGYASRAIIASRVGGIPEVIQEHTGIFVTPGDTNELVHALQTLLDDTQTRQKYGDRIHETITTQFTLTQMVRDTLQTYE